MPKTIVYLKKTGYESVCNRCATHLVFNELKLIRGEMESVKKAL